MLASLFIKNYAIIDSLEVEWSKGLTAITGETGAGKSIMIGALQFVLGARADSKILRNQDEKCIVEVRFNHLENKQTELSELEFLDRTDEIILRREILPNGRSRSFINDSPANVNELLQLSPILIAIHQQFDHLDILEESFQLEMVDSYTDQLKTIELFKKKYKKYKQLLLEKKVLEEEQKKSNEEKDFLEFQLNEFEQIQINPNEYTSLEEELTIALRSEEIVKNISAVNEIINAEKGALDMLHSSSSLLKSISVVPSISEINNRIIELNSELKDISHSLDRIADKTEFDPEKINNLQERYNQITRLIKKHRVKNDVELFEIWENLSLKRNGFLNLDDHLDQKNKEINKLYEELMSEAKLISNHRRTKTKSLASEIVQLLKLLGMEHAQISLSFETLSEISESGLDRLDLLFSANKGTAPKPLKNQASGGELSRLNLVLKSLMSKKSKLPTMIFDEIDTGVSGQIALQMGNILLNMSKDHQLITITHSAQVASRATHHYFVYKDSSSKITNTRFKKLEKEERMIELAKMLSGDPPSASAIQNANDLISSAN
ncbi:MAG: DNA repair protein RecN [Saprospiraceae bacterium]